MMQKLFIRLFPNEIAVNATQHDINPINGSSPPSRGQITIIIPKKPRKIPIHFSIVILSLIKITARKQVRIGCMETTKEDKPAEVPFEIAKKTPPK